MSRPNLVGRCLVLALLVVGACVVALPGQDSKPQGKKVALLVGVRAYNNVNFSELKYTENDVEELAEVLKPAGFTNIRVLTTKRGQKRRGKLNAPTALNIRN